MVNNIYNHIGMTTGRLLTLVMLAALSVSAPLRAQRLSVNTDLAMDAIMAPSLGMELTVGGKSTLNLNGLYSPGVLGNKDLRITAVQPEWRVYISGRPMYHHYVGAIGLFTSYKLLFDGKWHDGDAVGAGVSFGYVYPLKDRLLLDFHTSLGGVYYHQKEYMRDFDYDNSVTNAEGYPVANATGSLLIPLRIGVSLTYIIK